MALDAATGEWILSIDADEELDDQLQKSIKSALEVADCAGYLLMRKSRFLGSWIMHSGWYPDLILRLFKKSKARFTDARVHEKVEV